MNGQKGRGGPKREPSWFVRERRLEEVRRQVRATPREPAGRGPRAALALATAIWLAAVAWAFVTLPERVPTHWSSSDVPDDWSTKAEALSFMILMPVFTAYPLILLSRLVTAWPDGVNVRHKEWWLSSTRRLVRFERLLREDMMVLAAMMVALFAWMTVDMGLAAHRPGGTSPMWLTAVVVSVFLGGILVWTLRLTFGARYKPYPDGDDEPDA